MQFPTSHFINKRPKNITVGYLIFRTLTKYDIPFLRWFFKTSLLAPNTPQTTLLNQSSYSKFQHSCPFFIPLVVPKGPSKFQTYVTFCTMLLPFTMRRCYHLPHAQNQSCCVPPPVGCPRPLFQYIFASTLHSWRPSASPCHGDRYQPNYD